MHVSKNIFHLDGLVQSSHDVRRILVDMLQQVVQLAMDPVGPVEVGFQFEIDFIPQFEDKLELFLVVLLLQGRLFHNFEISSLSRKTSL